MGVCHIKIYYGPRVRTLCGGLFLDFGTLPPLLLERAPFIAPRHKDSRESGHGVGWEGSIQAKNDRAALLFCNSI